jgi:hypothetical protein
MERTTPRCLFVRRAVESFRCSEALQLDEALVFGF